MAPRHASGAAGSRPYVADRAARGGRKLALNLDIDNTSLQTYYDPGKAIPATLRLARYAKSKGVYVLFNTGRNVKMRDRTIRQLRRAGFPVDGLCAHYKGESLAHSKQRCRRSFVNNGLQDHRQRGQPQHGLRRRQLRARLPAAELRKPPGLSTNGG